MAKIRKAVFPVAGLGTRMLPATKSIPKELLTVVDRPVIQYVVDEAREAGIEHFVFVTGRQKHAIEDYFDTPYELEHMLNLRGNQVALQKLEGSRMPVGRASFTRQQQPQGLGHAVWCARDLIGNEPFAVLLPDMLMKSEKGCLAQMMDTFEENPGSNVVAVEQVAMADTHRYGIVAGRDMSGTSFQIDHMVEKPAIGTAPSNWIISGRYIFQPDIFAIIEQQMPDARGEIQLTDAMAELAASKSFHAVKYRGETFDCGNEIGFVSANLAFALDHAVTKVAIKRLIEEAAQRLPEHVAPSMLQSSAREGRMPGRSQPQHVLNEFLNYAADAPTAKVITFPGSPS